MYKRQRTKHKIRDAIMVAVVILAIAVLCALVFFNTPRTRKLIVFSGRYDVTDGSAGARVVVLCQGIIWSDNTSRYYIHVNKTVIPVSWFEVHYLRIQSNKTISSIKLVSGDYAKPIEVARNGSLYVYKGVVSIPIAGSVKLEITFSDNKNMVVTVLEAREK